MIRRRLFVWFAAVLVLAVAGRLHMERVRTDRCRLDGVRITPIYEVDLMRDGRILARFCSVRCATEWPDVPRDVYWQVRDEVTGEVLDAAAACFVESSVVTVPARQDRTHVFKAWADAMTHAAEYDGVRIPNPLARSLNTADEPEQTTEHQPTPSNGSRP